MPFSPGALCICFLPCFISLLIASGARGGVCFVCVLWRPERTCRPQQRHWRAPACRCSLPQTESTALWTATASQHSTEQSRTLDSSAFRGCSSPLTHLQALTHQEGEVFREKYLQKGRGSSLKEMFGAQGLNGNVIAHSTESLPGPLEQRGGHRRLESPELEEHRAGTGPACEP